MGLKAIPELRLAERLGESDLAALYDGHAPAMLGLARRILGSRGDAEDLVHDVFIEAWERADGYDPSGGSVRSWLLSRVRSRAIDRLRRRHRNVAAVTERGDTGQPAVDASFWTEFEAARAALAKLSKVQREAIVLAYFEGLTAREIALRCRIPEGTAKSRLAAGLSSLRALVAGGAET